MNQIDTEKEAEEEEEIDNNNNDTEWVKWIKLYERQKSLQDKYE